MVRGLLLDVERNALNIHLRTVGALSDELDNPAHPFEESETVALRNGQEAWCRLRDNSTWKDWTAVGAAHVLGRNKAMCDAHSDIPKGRDYNAAFSAWQKRFGFEGLDSGDQTRLFKVMDHLKVIDGWLNKLPEKEQLRLNHPSSIWRRWKAANKPQSTESSEPKPSPYKKLQAEHLGLIELHDRMKREIERGGGDLWSAEDHPRDIARVIVAKLSKKKAESVAREILDALKVARHDDSKMGRRLWQPHKQHRGVRPHIPAR
jgi:hypothetical protein